jgi:integrase
MMPAVARRPLEEHLSIVRARHEADLAKGFGRVVLPFALERKFPNAASEWGWQFVFPAARICRNPKWGAPTRFHLHESVVQRAVTETARRVGLTKRVSCHTRSESRRGGSRDAEGAETRREQRRGGAASATRTW